VLREKTFQFDDEQPKNARSTLHYSIARGLFGFQQPVQMAFLTYLDTSGSALDPRVKTLSVGGFVGHEDTWADFEPKWEAVLRRFEVSELHMKDYAHSQGEFAGWRDQPQKRAEFMGEIGALIKGSALQPIGATLPLSVYRLFNRDYCVEEAIGTPYAFAAMSAIAVSTQWRDRNHINEPILFFIEKGDNQQEDLRRYFRRIIWDSGYVTEPVFHPKKWTDREGNVHRVIPYQASDFIAYEQAKTVTDLIVHNKTQVRQSFRSAVKPIEDLPDGRTYWTVIAVSSMTKAMKAQRVPQRYNRPGADSHRKLPVDPLCYVNGRPAVAYFYEDGYLKDEG
jgi:hypothetical protein